MNVYFTASLAAKQQYIQNYQQIVETLKKQQCAIIADHILGETESSIKLQTREERLQFHKQLEDWINDCDCVVVEASFPSISVGYEISMALHRGKPVLVLYSEGDPPSLLAYPPDEKIVCERSTRSSAILSRIYLVCQRKHAAFLLPQNRRIPRTKSQSEKLLNPCTSENSSKKT